MSSNPTYDILGHPMGQGRPISSRPDELRTSSQQPPQPQAPQMNQPSQYQYQHTPMQPFYANLGMPYYPVIGQRNPNGKFIAALSTLSKPHFQHSSQRRCITINRVVWAAPTRLTRCAGACATRPVTLPRHHHLAPCPISRPIRTRLEFRYVNLRRVHYSYHYLLSIKQYPNQYEHLPSHVSSVFSCFAVILNCLLSIQFTFNHFSIPLPRSHFPNY